MDDGRRRRTDNGACLYYKLTYEPKGSGELKIEEKKEVPNSENPKVVFSLFETVFETVKLSVSISPRNLCNSSKSI